MNKHFEKQVAVITGEHRGLVPQLQSVYGEEGAVIAILDMKAAPLNDDGVFFKQM